MREVTICGTCDSRNINYMGLNKFFCNKCRSEQPTRDIYVESPYERTRRAVYATGNR